MVDYEAVSAYIQGREEVSVPELQRKFSADYLSIVKIVRRLVSEGALTLASGVNYAVSKRKEEPAEEPVGNAAKRRAYLEARRREILKSMREEDDDDDDDEDDEDDDEDGVDLSDELPLEVYALVHDLNDSASVVEEDDMHYLVPHGLTCNGERVRMRISLREDGVYLTDDLITFRSLGDRAPSDDDARVVAIAAHCGIAIDGDQLEVKIESPQDTVPRMMQLFAAMERIVALAEEDAICAEYREEDDRIWEIAREYLAAEPEMDRGALVCRMRERYQSVKDGDDVDEIVLSARGVKEFARMSDENFLKSRKILLGEEEAGEAEDDGNNSTDNGEDEAQESLSSAEEIERTAEIITEPLARAERWRARHAPRAGERRTGLCRRGRGAGHGGSPAPSVRAREGRSRGIAPRRKREMGKGGRALLRRRKGHRGRADLRRPHAAQTYLDRGCVRLGQILLPPYDDLQFHHEVLPR